MVMASAWCWEDAPIQSQLAEGWSRAPEARWICDSALEEGIARKKKRAGGRRIGWV